jgi:hypothetical protein
MEAVLTGLDKMWRCTEDAPYIVERMGEMLRRVMYQFYSKAQACTPEKTARLQRVAVQMKEKGIGNSMEVLANWYPRTRRHPHVMFLVADLMKTLHPTAQAAAPARTLTLPTSSPNGNKPLSSEEVGQALENLNFL